LANCEQRI